MAARKFGDKFPKVFLANLWAKKLQTECFHSPFTIFFEIVPHPLVAKRSFCLEWRSSCRRSDKSAKKTHRMNNGWWKTFLCYRASFTAIEAEEDEKFMQMKNSTNEAGKFGNYLKIQRRTNATRVFSVYSYFALKECLECSLETRQGWKPRQVAC